MQSDLSWWISQIKLYHDKKVLWIILYLINHSQICGAQFYSKAIKSLDHLQEFLTHECDISIILDRFCLWHSWVNRIDAQMLYHVLIACHLYLTWMVRCHTMNRKIFQCCWTQFSKHRWPKVNQNGSYAQSLSQVHWASTIVDSKWIWTCSNHVKS